MWKPKRKWRYCLLALFLLAAFGSTSRAETMYQMSGSELTQLEANLQALKKNNENKQTLLTEQKAQLSAASRELEMVRKQLTESMTLNEATQKSLASANQSLQQLEQEAKRKVRIKARQRNLWILISGGLLYAYIRE